MNEFVLLDGKLVANLPSSLHNFSPSPSATSAMTTNALDNIQYISPFDVGVHTLLSTEHERKPRQCRWTLITTMCQQKNHGQFQSYSTSSHNGRFPFDVSGVNVNITIDGAFVGIWLHGVLRYKYV